MISSDDYLYDDEDSSQKKLQVRPLTTHARGRNISEEVPYTRFHKGEEFEESLPIDVEFSPLVAAPLTQDFIASIGQQETDEFSESLPLDAYIEKPSAHSIDRRPVSVFLKQGDTSTDFLQNENGAVRKRVYRSVDNPGLPSLPSLPLGVDYQETLYSGLKVDLPQESDLDSRMFF